MTLDTRLTKLTKQALALPKPHQTRAMGNVENARRDLLSWPTLRREILDDLERAIEYHQAAVRIEYEQ